MTHAASEDDMNKVLEYQQFSEVDRKDKKKITEIRFRFLVAIAVQGKNLLLGTRGVEHERAAASLCVPA